VELVITPEALESCAEEAIRHKTGARGLRTVLEDTLLDVMYEIPSRGDVKKCVVSADTIIGRAHPLMLARSGQVVGGGAEEELRDESA
jgi:ATP-dependent Clp protease ATP-binding subunit ClpX